MGETPLGQFDAIDLVFGRRVVGVITYQDDGSSDARLVFDEILSAIEVIGTLRVGQQTLEHRYL